MRYSCRATARIARNVIERIVIMNPTTTRFDRKHLPPCFIATQSPASEANSPPASARDAYERDYILKKLDKITETSAAPPKYWDWSAAPLP